MKKIHEKHYAVQQDQFTLVAGPDGVPNGMYCNDLYRELEASTSMVGCTKTSHSVHTLNGDDGWMITKTYREDATGSECTVTETFQPTQDSICWNVTLESYGGAWTTPIESTMRYKDASASKTKFWAPWADAEGSHEGSKIYENQRAPCYSGEKDVVTESWSPDILQWADPLVPQPFVDRTFGYGANVYTEEKPYVEYLPFHKDIICIPLATVLEEEAGFGISLTFSPEDIWLDASLTTDAMGNITLTRFYHRLGEGRKLDFSMDLVLHEDDWRGGLRWMTRRYPAYFLPEEPMAQQVTGCGGYSGHDAAFDIDKMKQMAFGVNWKASFDFPYMGMFLPPVNDTLEWEDFKNNNTSIQRLRTYSEMMQAAGFHVLNYFNVTEFGAHVVYPPVADHLLPKEDLWKDGDSFMYQTFPNAILLGPLNVTEHIGYGPRPKPGLPYYTWGGGIVTDAGEPKYQEFLVEQAKMHVEKLPASSGICIDRLDWLRLYSNQRDDGVSFIGGKKVHSLYQSFNQVMARLAEVFHAKHKVIYCNNHTKRIDILNHIDGIFDEFTYGGMSLNSTAFLCLQKPFIGWVGNSNQILREPDKFFQRFIYLGAHPMAPFPGNDHALMPDERVEPYFLDYGPMLRAMCGREWELSPHAIRINGTAKANLFKVPDGYIAPIMLGGEDTSTGVLINLPDVHLQTHTFAYLIPGMETAQPLKPAQTDGGLAVDVPMGRGCAMLLITCNES